MKCDDLKNWFADSLSGSGDEALDADARAHLAGCPKCSSEYETLHRLWDKLGNLGEAEPGRSMRARFYSMLDGYKDGIELSQGRDKGKRSGFWYGWLLPGMPALQIALAVLFLIAGAVIGRLSVVEGPGKSEITQLRSEVHEMTQMVALSLLQQQSASERLAGVSMSQRVGQPDEKVLNALVHALDFDPSVDVRLAAIDALYRFSDQRLVRRALVDSLPRQGSPLVQIALIDLIVELRERQSAEVLRRLADDGNINQAVRERARWGLQRLS